MKQTRSFFLLLSLLAVVFLGSCQKPQNVQYLPVPKDANVVVAVQLDVLKQKSGLEEILIPLLKEFGSDAITKKGIEILKNSRESGLALDEKVLFFAQVGQELTGFVARVSNVQKLKNTLHLLEEEGIFSPVTAESGYNQTLLADKSGMAVFNDQVLLFIPNRGDAGRQAQKLLNQKAEESILFNLEYAKQVDSNEDISVYLSLNSIESTDIPLLDFGFDISKLSMAYGLSFLNGAIRFKGEILSSDPEIQDVIQNQLNTLRSVSLSHLDYFPDTTPFYTLGNVDGAAYGALMKKYMNAFFSSPLAVLSEVKAEEIEEVTSVVNAICGSLDGEITLGVPGVSMLGIPNVLLYADVKNDDLVKLLNKYLPQIEYVAGVKKLDGNNYRCDPIFPIVSIYYGEKNGLFYLTTDATLCNTIGQKGETSLKEAASVGRIPKGAKMYGVIELESILNLPIVKTALVTLNPAIENLLSQPRYIEFHSTDGAKMELTIQLIDDKQNALKSVADLFNLQALF